MHPARRFCSTPRCPRLATHRGKCAECRATADRARGSSTERGYDAQWTAYSQAWLQLHRWCGERADFRLHAEHSRCVQQGQRTRATVTDHIVSMRQGGARLNATNHQSLCRRCNSLKAIAVEGAFAQVR